MARAVPETNLLLLLGLQTESRAGSGQSARLYVFVTPARAQENAFGCRVACEMATQELHFQPIQSHDRGPAQVLAGRCVSVTSEIYFA